MDRRRRRPIVANPVGMTSMRYTAATTVPLQAEGLVYRRPFGKAGRDSVSKAGYTTPTLSDEADTTSTTSVTESTLSLSRRIYDGDSEWNKVATGGLGWADESTCGTPDTSTKETIPCRVQVLNEAGHKYKARFCILSLLRCEVEVGRFSVTIPTGRRDIERLRDVDGFECVSCHFFLHLFVTRAGRWSGLSSLRSAVWPSTRSDDRRVGVFV